MCKRKHRSGRWSVKSSVTAGLVISGLSATFLLAAPISSRAQSSQAEINALRDIAASQRQQSELMRRQAQRDSERAWREENAYVNAKRDARSMRRFDR